MLRVTLQHVSQIGTVTLNEVDKNTWFLRSSPVGVAAATRIHEQWNIPGVADMWSVDRIVNDQGDTQTFTLAKLGSLSMKPQSKNDHNSLVVLQHTVGHVALVLCV